MPLSSLFDLSSFDFSLWCILKCLLKSNKCNQCDFAFFRADNLTKYLKAHSGEKFKKCNQCDFPSFQAGNFRTLLKTQVEDQSIKVYSSKQPNLILLLLPRIHKYRTTVLFAVVETKMLHHFVPSSKQPTIISHNISPPTT